MKTRLQDVARYACGKHSFGTLISMALTSMINIHIERIAFTLTREVKLTLNF
jgi:hypothetical protein